MFVAVVGSLNEAKVINTLAEAGAAKASAAPMAAAAKNFRPDIDSLQQGLQPRSALRGRAEDIFDRPLACRSRRDERLAEPRLIMSDRRIRERHDLGRRAVIHIEREHLRRGISFGEFEDIVIIRASESIDRLFRIAHDKEIA